MKEANHDLFHANGIQVVQDVNQVQHIATEEVTIHIIMIDTNPKILNAVHIKVDMKAVAVAQ